MKCLGMISAVFLFLSIARAAAAGPTGGGEDLDCPPESFFIVAAGDTVRVQHNDAKRNCCTDLAVVINVEENEEGPTINFFEQEVGSPCRCLCCYDSAYEAHGLSPGRYLVRVWAGVEPAVLFTMPVDVLGAGTAAEIGTIEGGVCQRTPTSKSSWGTLRLLYR